MIPSLKGCAKRGVGPKMAEKDFFKQLDLEHKCREIRRLILSTACHAGCGHTGGSLSCVEILAALYLNCMKIDPKNPSWNERDRFVLSKGHCTLAYYSVLALKGYFPPEELDTFDKVDSRLQGHPDMRKLPGVDMSTGSLGQGISVGIGMALGLKWKNMAGHVFVLVGDGELQEGQNWEAFMFAGHRNIGNITVIIDNNKLQLSGRVDELLSLEPLEEKISSFKWNVFRSDGHDIAQLVSSINTAKSDNMPSVIIADTNKGKGYSRAELNVAWHGLAPSKEELNEALKELGY